MLLDYKYCKKFFISSLTSIHYCIITWCAALATQSCPTLCDPMDCSTPGSSVHRILQARILEWIPTAFSRRTSQPRDGTQSPPLQVDSLPSEPPGKPINGISHHKNRDLMFYLFIRMNSRSVPCLSCLININNIF